MTYKVCVVTGSRAEYGLLRWLMSSIDKDPELTLQVIATGSHLTPEFGLTYQAIEGDGFRIDYKVDMLLSSNTEVGIAKSMGVGMLGFADAFHSLNPDVVVFLGDRFEIFAAGGVAAAMKVPICHLHGGEVTEGAIDESLRHALTKLAHLHFVATETSKQRVLQMGEAPDRVFNFGAPGLDNLARLKFLSKQELEADLGYKFQKTNLLVTYHPETLSMGSNADDLDELLNVLSALPTTGVIFTLSNADAEGRKISERVAQYVAQNGERMACFPSLGQLRYLSCMRLADAVVGNSSSGIIEAPAIGVPTVNIGDRQKGRERAASVIDCLPTAVAIGRALKLALDADTRRAAQSQTPPYGKGSEASVKIKDALKAALQRSDRATLLRKPFYH